MGLATDLVRFFQPLNSPVKDNVIRPWAITDFLKAHPQHWESLHEVSVACGRLTAEGLLHYAGHNGNAPPLGDQYYSMANVNDDLANYGVFEFIVFGFPLIRNHFEKSVLPLVTSGEDGQERVGSGFLIDNNRLITAAHCVKNMRSIRIPGWNPNSHHLNRIHVPADERVDLAVLSFSTDSFPDAPKFRLQSFEVLDEVLTMGYPPIPGFQDFLVSETARVAGYLKSTVGQIISTATSYLDRQDYALVSARVKGGNSGGPVVGKRGGVIGVVAATPGDDAMIDTLGYGLVIPHQTVISFLEDAQSSSQEVRSLPYSIFEDAIATV